MRKLTTRGRYGLRGMIELAHFYGKRPLQTGIIAEHQHISKKYLHALFHLLKQAHLINVKRGARGGLMLSREPSSITVLEILEVLEGEQLLVECIKNSNDCAYSEYCEAQDLWNRLNNVIVDYLGEKTLQDLVR